ncbi:hypothetical protein PV325_004274 [Microctonus aethiopoides]|uniref:AAA+ ATPase domain-containing protein n=1 Tax=Microctonus aethiopoides TaxID=144406 RepID=A0AA39FMC6_9HYME|nr:hypothetical protein PV325_004274 [Microctonus aethiopoides]KAK0172262.1 hypothetical protein PV328_005602 [Microctonus aethiopoides]
MYKYYEKIKCSYNECCNDHYIPQDVRELHRLLNIKVFGQKIATDSILRALYAHTNTDNTPKALAMSFHGTSGTGKTFVANMIGETFYKKGYQSQYFHFINGRSDLTLESEVEQYKEMLQKKIVQGLLECPKSLFIFDEIDSMPAGVLNILVPLLDYGKPRVWPHSSNNFVETRKAIYIFITNAGSEQIVERVINLRGKGKSRNDTTLADYEDVISVQAFSEDGGFYKSDIISNNLIDHYVPFLPLEVQHIKLCIEAAFRIYGSSPTIKQIDEVLSHLKFGPEPHNLYSQSGCKRIETKVASVVYKRGVHNEL